MQRDADSDSYSVWPFRAEKVSPDGDRNNGGIDLVAQPELIELIHEATVENGLRDLLIALNKQGGTFMTLGCLAGDDEGTYYSYVELTLQDSNSARNENTIKEIHAQWLTWLTQNCAHHAGLPEALCSQTVWTYREFSLRGGMPQFLITITSRARSADEHGLLISWVNAFLSSVEIKPQ